MITITITQSPTHNTAGILVYNSDPDSHFCSGCAEKAQNLFLNFLKIKSPQQANPGKLLRNVVLYQSDTSIQKYINRSKKSLQLDYTTYSGFGVSNSKRLSQIIN